MSIEPDPKSSPDQNSGTGASNQSLSKPGAPCSSLPRRRRPWVGILLTAVGLFAAGLIVFSIYVAVHEPDPQETVILGQNTVAAASPAGWRVLVRQRASGRPVRGAAVTLILEGKASGITRLGTFRTDADGSLSDTVNIPELVPGKYQLVVDVTSPLGRDHIVRQVEVQRPVRILLSSDKPLYQPGQTIHLRSLISNARTQKPLADQPVTFEVSDPKGNKVFKETRNLSAFGIASADFVLASELNLGRYEIRAISGAVTAERAVEIKRYVLPKFKISLSTDKPYYLPGQTVSGAVQADYFFGKAVAGATVRLSASTFQEKPVLVSELQGRTDAAGRYSFQFVLPDFFVGLPQNDEHALLELSAEVVDTGRHAEQKAHSLSVAKTELELAAIPEGGAFVPGVENILYVLADYPDGRPARCRIFYNGTGYQGDSQGVCAIKLVPTGTAQRLELQAIDDSGRKARLNFLPEKTDASPPLLIRTDRAVYGAGQTAHLTLLSPEANSTVFIDVIEEGQTVLTKSVSLNNHKAEYELPLPASMVGALKLNAYMITGAGEDRGRSRLIYVNPASALQIKASLDKPVYRPGEVARMEFSVTDAEGHAAPAALGISAVDESAFALSEDHPGLLQQFLDVESDLLKPRYQIKFFSAPERWLSDAEGSQTLAQAYFSTWGDAPAAPGLDALTKAEYLPPKILERVRAMRGTPAYEALRNDARYGDIMRRVEGEGGTYNLREATGPVKIRAVEAHRQAYFNALKKYLLMAFCGSIFLLPIIMIIYHSLSAVGIRPGAFAAGQHARYAALASTSYHLLAALTLCPLIFYPLGLMFFEHRNMEEQGWLLLALETSVVLATLAFQLWQLARAKTGDLAEELRPLQTFVLAFLAQFILSRGAVLLMFSSGGYFSENFGPLWFLGSLTAPLFVLGGLGSHVRRQMTAKGTPGNLTRVTVVDILIIISVIFVLAGLLLPSLAKAKAKAQRASLMNDLKQIELAGQMGEEDAAKPGTATGAAVSPRVRRDFPETLFWRPELITDDRGRATLEIPLADSITTWRASVEAVSSAGKMGSTETPIAVFQDFFVDLDLPVAMSLNDEVSVPVTCYNYLKEPQDIEIRLTPAKWFETAEQVIHVHLDASEVKSASFPLGVRQVGNQVLRVTARGRKTADAIEREIRVVPTGERMEHTRNDSLKDNFTDTFLIPTNAIPGSAGLGLKFYPSRFSEVVEGLDSIFQAPYGCFEQTSSTTYPNVLVLDYLKRMGRLTPEIEIKARKYINAGYQRLLTFEVPGGGFEWFGRSPAHVGLTAYGVMEFVDMSRVQPVDEALIERTRKWLLSKQNADGSWNQAGGLDEFAAACPVTAYVTWALAETGVRSGDLDKALNYLRSHPKELATPYDKALAANAFLALNRNDSFGRELAAQLRETAQVDGDGKTIHWPSNGRGMTYSSGFGLDVETTALSAMAMMKAGQWPQSVKQALTWISAGKSSNGTWGSTQATVLAMRALLQGSRASLGQEFESTITLRLNGEKIETFRVNKDNSDVMKQIELTQKLRTGENRIEMSQSPAGELPFQITGACWLPEPAPAAGSLTANPPQAAPLEIDLRYDRTLLAVNEQLRCEVTVRNNTGRGVNMAMVDLGIPPGFEVDAAAFESMQEAGQVAKFEVTGNQVILYLRELSETTPLRFNYSLRAKYPLRVQTPPSVVYEYYQPRNRAESKSIALQVAKD